jgi:hypothetical protein
MREHRLIFGGLMSLLSDIVASLEGNDQVEFNGPNRNATLGSFVSIEFAVVPQTVRPAQEMSQLLRELLPMEPFRTYDFFHLVEPIWQWGELCFEEEIGHETITRTFAVDDGGACTDKTYDEGEQDPITQPLRRAIYVKLYPRTKHHLRFKIRQAA